MPIRVVFAVIFLLSTLLSAAPALGQLDCGVVDAIGYPLPLDRFRIGFGFGQKSFRFGGLLHGGEDYWGRHGRTLGEPVYAIARGRVTLSSPTAWGPDKGVVIIEHTMPDRSVWYSFYGHMEPLNGYEFPRENTCVEAGDIVGAIGAGRPSPHLHFEIRNFNPNQPGPNYWSVDPRTNGWANPTQFIVDWQTWLRGLDSWRLPLFRQVNAEAPAFMNADGSITYLDGNVIFTVTANRQYLWYSVALPDNPIGLTRTSPEHFTVALPDGTMQDWSIDGFQLKIWSAGGPPSGPPVAFGDLVLVHVPDVGLTAYDADRAPRWTVAGVGRIVSIAVDDAAGALALTDSAGQFWLIDRDGAVIDRAALARPGDVTPAAPEGFYLRSGRGLWRVSPTGVWRWLAEASRVNPARSRLLSAPDGFYLWTGQRQGGEIIAYDDAGTERWRARVESDLGRVHLTLDGACRLWVGGSTGYLLAFDMGDGKLASEARLYGDANRSPFVGLAGDGLVRFLIYDKLVAFDGEKLAGPCR